MIRQAKPLDNYAIANIIVSGWKTAYKGLINDEFLDNLSVDIKAENWKNIILSQNENNHIYIYEENNEILGVIRFGKPDENYNNYNAEIHVLYVRPSLKRKGIGTKLFNFAKKYFLEQNTNQIGHFLLLMLLFSQDLGIKMSFLYSIENKKENINK